MTFAMQRSAIRRPLGLRHRGLHDGPPVG
jgi:hypothetical protein